MPHFKTLYSNTLNDFSYPGLKFAKTSFSGVFCANHKFRMKQRFIAEAFKHMPPLLKLCFNKLQAHFAETKMIAFELKSNLRNVLRFCLNSSTRNDLLSSLKAQNCFFFSLFRQLLKSLTILAARTGKLRERMRTEKKARKTISDFLLCWEIYYF